MKTLLCIVPAMAYIYWGYRPALHDDFDWDNYHASIGRLKKKVKRGGFIKSIVVKSTNPNYRQHGEE